MLEEADSEDDEDDDDVSTAAYSHALPETFVLRYNISFCNFGVLTVIIKSIFFI